MNIPKTGYKVIVVGAGMTGMQCSLSLAYEGIPVLMIEKRSIGGQAGESARIDNILGFPHGVSGRHFADSGIQQIQQYGGDILVPFEAQRVLVQEDGSFVVVGENHETFSCEAIALAPGAQHRLLPARNVSSFMDRGIAYGSPTKTPDFWRGKRIAVIGGANSAAQAACYLAEECAPCEVLMIVRGTSIEDQMSVQMAKRVALLPNITVVLETEVEEAFGDDTGFKGVIARKKGGETERYELDGMNILIGAMPHTAWLTGLVALSPKGFIYTDRDLPEGAWPLKDRLPHMFETSVPGIFAAGDAEESAVRRASTALGYGSTMAANIGRYLKERRLARGVV